MFKYENQTKMTDKNKVDLYRVEFSPKEQQIHFALIDEKKAVNGGWFVISNKGISFEKCHEFAEVMNPKLFNTKINPLTLYSVKKELGYFLDM